MSVLLLYTLHLFFSFSFSISSLLCVSLASFCLSWVRFFSYVSFRRDVYEGCFVSIGRGMGMTRYEGIERQAGRRWGDEDRDDQMRSNE